MRKKIILLLSFAGLSAVLLIPATGIGQQGQGQGGNQDPTGGFGGKGKGGKKGGGFGGGGPGGGGKGGKKKGVAGVSNSFNDPKFLFDMLSGGHDIINIDSLPEEAQKWAQDNGLAGQSTMTRDVFEYMHNQTGGRVLLGIAKGNKGKNPFAKNLEGKSAAGFDADQLAAISFKMFDTNGDGVLNVDEMPERLKASLALYDKNGDGVITLEEFKAYFRDNMAEHSANITKEGDELYPEDELDKRPTVMRAGRLPKELPLWFAQLDTDGDGQVGMDEWWKAGKSLSEFQAMDRNGDGLLTAEEVLYYLKIKIAGPSATAIAQAGGAQTNQQQLQMQMMASQFMQGMGKKGRGGAAMDFTQGGGWTGGGMPGGWTGGGQGGYGGFQGGGAGGDTSGMSGGKRGGKKGKGGGGGGGGGGND